MRKEHANIGKSSEDDYCNSFKQLEQTSGNCYLKDENGSTKERNAC